MPAACRPLGDHEFSDSDKEEYEVAGGSQAPAASRTRPAAKKSTSKLNSASKKRATTPNPAPRTGPQKAPAKSATSKQPAPAAAKTPTPRTAAPQRSASREVMPSAERRGAPSRGGPAIVSIQGLAEDATSREVHVLFSGCPGYQRCDLVLDEVNGTIRGVVQFESREAALAASRARGRTCWELGLDSVQVEVLPAEVSERLLASPNLFQEDASLRSRGSGPGGKKGPPAAPMQQQVLHLQEHLNQLQQQYDLLQEKYTQLQTAPPHSGSGYSSRRAPSSQPEREQSPFAASAGGGGGGGGGVRRGRNSPGSNYRSVTPVRRGRQSSRGPTPSHIVAPQVSFSDTERARPEEGSPRAGTRTIDRANSPVSGARDAHLRRLRAKVDAYTSKGGVEDLQAILAEAVEAGLDDEALTAARDRLDHKQLVLLRRRAIHTETRAKARLKEVVIQVYGETNKGLLKEDKSKRPQDIALLEHAIRQGKEAADLLGASGLRSKEKLMRQVVNHASNQWKMECVTKVNSYLEKRDKAAIEAILPELQSAGFGEASETRLLYEAVQRISSGISSFDDEEREAVARGALNMALTCKRAPQIRAALQAMREAEADISPNEVERAKRLLRQAEERVNARWLLLACHALAKSSVLFEVEDSTLLLQEAVVVAETSNVPDSHLEESRATVERLEQFRTASILLQNAMQTRDLNELRNATQQVKEARSESPAVKHMLDKANFILREQTAKVGMKRRLEGALSQRKTLVMSTLPSILREAEDVGLDLEVMDEAERQLRVAKGKKNLETALYSKDPYYMKVALAEAEEAGVDEATIRAGIQVLEEAELRVDIETKINQGDRQGVERGLEIWRKRDFDKDFWTAGRAELKSMQAEAGICKRELDRTLQKNNVSFEADTDHLTEEGHNSVKALAEVLKNRPKVPVRVDGHYAEKNENSNKVMSLQRAEVVKDLLIALGVDNIIITKGWGSAHPEVKNRYLRITPF